MDTNALGLLLGSIALVVIIGFMTSMEHSDKKRTREAMIGVVVLLLLCVMCGTA